MRNRNIILTTGLLAMTLVGSALASPIPMSLIGPANLVAVDSRALPILTGGSFNARVADPTLLTPVSTTFWCVDLENLIDPGANSSQYRANIYLVSDTTANATRVRKGDTPTPSGWEDGEDFTAQQRYTAAAYLVEQIIAGGTTSQQEARQRAIWRLTDLTGGGQTANNATWENAFYTDAVDFIKDGGNTSGKWATVSGVASSGGLLIPDNTRQTFLVQVQSSVPEPGTYALMGCGLLLLAGLRRRNAS